MMTRRDLLKTGAVLTTAAAFADGGLAPVTKATPPARGFPVLPPGAAPLADFRRKCIGCGLCVAECPEGALKLSSAWKDWGRPQFDFTRGFCRLSCDYRCARVCPTGALAALPRVKRRDNHVGCAVWSRERCLRANGEECTACIRKCPVGAIRLIGAFPVVDAGLCIGCGACEHVCAARPVPAIHVEGFERARLVEPISKGDLRAEMLRLVREGECSLVLARGGVIVRRLSGRGVEPLTELCRSDPKALAGALVADRVVGRAAASFYVEGRVDEVAALVVSAAAKAMLEQAGIVVSASEVVPEILNRKRSGSCPLEERVRDIDDPAAMVERLNSPR